ncbi:hypothetical protein TNCV_3909411 [Trichonephila clavipes]|nr:hypothetical protein TNCV_3909411 [Trichonephila clavipes]
MLKYSFSIRRYLIIRYVFRYSKINPSSWHSLQPTPEPPRSSDIANFRPPRPPPLSLHRASINVWGFSSSFFLFLFNRVHANLTDLLLEVVSWLGGRSRRGAGHNHACVGA